MTVQRNGRLSGTSPKGKGPRTARADPRRNGHAELERLREALRRSEDRYRLLAENIVEVIWTMDLNLRYTFISPSILKLRGWTVEEAMTQTITDSVAPSSLEAVSRLLAEELTREQQGIRRLVERTIEVELLCKGGATIWTEIRMMFQRNDKGEPTGILGITRDITQRRRTEEDLKFRNALLSTEQEVSPDGILVVGENGGILSYNRRFIDMWEIPPDVIASKSDEQAIQAVLDKLVEPEKFVEKVRYLYEHRREESRDEISLKDGRVFDRFSASMHGANDRYYGRVWNFRDITARRRAEENVRKANERLSAMVRKLEERGLQNSLLTEMREFLQACSTPGEIGPVIVRSLKKLFPGSEGALFLLSSSRTDLEASVRWGDFPDDIDNNVFVPDACWGLRRGGMYVVEDIDGGLICPHLKQPPASAYACLPLMAKGDVLGLLHIRQHEGGKAEGAGRMISEVKEIASTLSEILSLSISNIKLRETLSTQSIRDPLTGLFNRRYMEDNLQREISRAARKREHIGVIMADIDHFKTFNDLHGHPAGDAALAELAAFFASRMRESDIVCRYGGEEFTLILPECSGEDAALRANQLVAEARTLKIQAGGRMFGPVTLSMGVATYPQNGANPMDLLKMADAALYRAKQEGRDRVILAQPGMGGI